MRSLSLSPSAFKHSSALWFESEKFRGVRFAIRRISLGLRFELTRRVRELSLREEFLSAGSAPEKLEATLNDLEVQQVLLKWGVIQVEGLDIDDEPANVGLLIDKGPEALTGEILDRIHSQLQLSDDERKNS